MLLNLCAGLCLFLLLYDRYLLLLRDSPRKSLLIRLAAIGLPLGSAAAGAVLSPRAQWSLPIIALSALTASETVRIVFRLRSIPYRVTIESHPFPSTSDPATQATPRPSRIVTTTDLIVKRYRLTSGQWKGRPFRIVHLTDLHAGPETPTAYLNHALRVAEEVQADLALFTGDFITSMNSLAELRTVLRPVGRIRNFACLGNHDFWGEPDKVQDTVQNCGIEVIRNKTETVEIDGVPLAVTGWDHPWDPAHPCLPEGLPDTVNIVLSHTPDNVFRIAQTRSALIFSGHLHGGQWRLPILGPVVVPSRYGRTFDQGHFVIGDTHLFVSSGIGVSNLPIRVYCRPEILVVELTGVDERR